MIETVVIISFFITKLLPERMVKGLLFGGELQSSNKTKFAVEKYVERYKDSIDTLNKTFLFNIIFVVLALLPFLGIIEGTTIKIPLTDLNISVTQWFKFCPLISYALQLYTFVSLVWFLLLRKGLFLLENELGEEEYFGDVSDILLTGLMSVFWLFISIFYYFKTKWQYIWFLPVLLTVVLVAMSPTLLCGYFIVELYYSNNLWLAIFYTILFIPSFLLSIFLIGIGGLLISQREEAKTTIETNFNHL